MSRAPARAALLLIVLLAGSAAASSGAILTYYLHGNGRPMTEDPQQHPALVWGTHTRQMETSGDDLRQSAVSLPLAAPLTLSAQDTFRLHLEQRTPLQTGNFTTNVRVFAFVDEDENRWKNPDGTTRFLGDATFTVHRVARPEALPNRLLADAALSGEAVAWVNAVHAGDRLMRDFVCQRNHPQMCEVYNETLGGVLDHADREYGDAHAPAARAAAEEFWKLQKETEQPVPEENLGWRDLRFDLNASLLGPGEDHLTIPAGYRLVLEFWVIFDGAIPNPGSAEAYAEARSEAEPVVAPLLPDETPVHVPVSGSCCRFTLYPEDMVLNPLRNLEHALSSLDQRVRLGFLPVSFYELDRKDAPSRLEVRLAS